MSGESGKSRNGTIHRYYKCHAVKKKLNDCKKKAVKKEWIEDIVVKETVQMLMDDAMIEAIVSMLMRLQDEENTDLPMYEKLIDTFVSAVFVHDDKLLLTFNFKDGTRTITFNDVKTATKMKNGSDLDCLGAEAR